MTHRRPTPNTNHPVPQGQLTDTRHRPHHTTGRTAAPADHQLAQETLEFRLESDLSAVVLFGGTWIAFQPLKGTGPLAPRQAAPLTDRAPAGPGVPVTAERRGEGAQV
ncbi:hypothetical protein GCM10010496_65910 [Streptomyces asoensis]|nr:hypothetical protein GCM10010496_65910 [Streptomyces asoensis]